MKLRIIKDGDPLSCFDEINQNKIDNTSSKRILSNNHELDATKGKIKGYLKSGHLFGFCKTFNKITKIQGFDITFKTADLKHIIYTTIGDAINTTINNLCLYVPVFPPSAETQTMFNESVKNNSTIAYDVWCTDRNVVNDGLQFQVDIGSTQNINSPKCLIALHQSFDRMGVSNNARKIAIFDNLDVRKCFCGIDGQKNPKDAIITNYIENDYSDQ